MEDVTGHFRLAATIRCFMGGLGIAEIIVVIVVFGAIFGWLAWVVWLDHKRKNESGHGGVQKKARRPEYGQAQFDDHQSIIAHLTQRFCPQCRAPLAADSPHGLCPACLMAGGLGSAALVGPDIGNAITTPPSGSQPPLAGEVGDLQRHFPQLEILELLGRGGMGAVYKARQINLDRMVALKVIPPDAAKDPAFAERFAREARALARLNHPNIVTVYDFGQAGEVYFLLMEYVDGLNLRQTLRTGHLAPQEALAIVPSICDALQYAHDQGVVHRDIKPENVLLDRTGRVKIADFGLAKLLGKGPDDFTLTRTQQVMGTPRYMAPEQIEKPATVDHRADIYSLGVMIYEMLTGELPMGNFQPPSKKVQIDVRIDQVVLRALEREPDRRYQRASHVKSELATASGWRASPSAPVWNTPAPAWKTPAPAAKFDPDEEGLSLARPPLGMVLAVALGMVLGGLFMTAGFVIAALALLGIFPSPLAAWLGAAFGCVAGGFGSAAGSYNTYRQMSGAEDLMRSRHVTWLDWVMRAYSVLGFGLLFWGALLTNGTPKNATMVLTLGGIIAFQGCLFLILRTLMRPPAGKQAHDPHLEAARRRVNGPAVGLIVAGILGLLPLALLLVIAPAFTDQSDSSTSTERAPPTIHENSDSDKPHGPNQPGGGNQPPGSNEPVGLNEAGKSDAALSVVTSALTFAVTGAQPTLASAAVPPLVFAASAFDRNPPLFVFGLLSVFDTFIAIIILVGAWQMRQLKSYGLAVIACVLAILPCTLTWFVSMPMGIWALVVLMRPDVREAFES